jgi:hypothetical protein
VSSVASRVLQRNSLSNQPELSSSTDEKVLQDVLATMYAGRHDFSFACDFLIVDTYLQPAQTRCVSELDSFQFMLKCIP